MFPNKVACEKEDRLGVIDNVMYIVRTEVLQNRHHNSSVGNDGHIGNAPTRIVLSDDGYFIATPQLAILEQQMQTGYLASHVAIRISCVFTIIGVARKIPVLAEAAFVQLDEIFLYHCTDN